MSAGDARHIHPRALLRVDDTGLVVAQQRCANMIPGLEQLRQARHRPNQVSNTGRIGFGGSPGLDTDAIRRIHSLPHPLFSNAALLGCAEAKRLVDAFVLSSHKQVHLEVRGNPA